MTISENEHAINGLEKMLFELHPNNEAIYKAIKALNEKRTTISEPHVPFPIKGNVMSKILFSLSRMGRFSTLHHIKGIILENEPSFTLTLSSALTKLQEEKKIISFKPTGANKITYYGFPKWMGDNGIPMQDYMPFSIDYSEI
jgi:hypothetical protein